MSNAQENKKARIIKLLRVALLMDRATAAVIFLLITGSFKLFSIIMVASFIWDSFYSIPQFVAHILNKDKEKLKRAVDYSYIGFSVILGCGLFVSFGWMIALPITIAIGVLALYYSPQLVILMLTYVR